MATKIVSGTGAILFEDTGGTRQLTRDMLIDATGGDRIYYLDPTSGSDTNDGLTSGTAFATFDKAFSKFAGFWTGKARIILLGAITLNSARTYAFGGGIGPSAEPLFIIGSFSQTLATRTSTAGTSGTSLVDSTLSMTTDQYVGRIARMTSGAASGNRRTIIANDTTSLTLASSIGSASSGHTFVIEQPSTTTQITISATVRFAGASPIGFVGVRFAMAGGSLATDIFCAMYLQACEVAGTSGSPILQSNQGGLLDLGLLINSSYDFSSVLTGSVVSCGCYAHDMFSVRSNGAGAFVGFNNCVLKTISSLTPIPLGRMDITGTAIIGGGLGGANSDGAMIRFVSGTIRDVTGVGLRISQRMTVRILSATIKNCTTYAVQIDRGAYADVAGLTGTGNGTGFYIDYAASAVVDSTTANDATGLLGTAGANVKIGGSAATTWTALGSSSFDSTRFIHLQVV